jgi:uncharacterized protein (TIGR00730 family)
MQHICVFCGSASGTNPEFTRAARTLGEELARRSLTLIYGGGRIGLMGEVATAATQHGGQVVGVIPQLLSQKEIAYEAATELVIVDSMHTRKAMMADRADAFVALPGGYGTCDELFEILTWAQLGIHAKPVGLLNVGGFFTKLLEWLDHITHEGLLKSRHRELLIVRDTVPELLDAMAKWQPVEPVVKWMPPEGR